MVRWTTISAAFLILTSVVLSGPTLAASESRDEAIRQANVWKRPFWITEDFRFHPTFDVSASPTDDFQDLPLLEDNVSCEMTEKSVRRKMGGKTRKLYCELRTPSLVKKDLVKFKYRFEDGEVPGEILGTRLLWSLGFAADRMFPIDTLDCFGCTEDPFFDRRIDNSNQAKPRQFMRVAAERKFKGKEVKSPLEGWRFNELMDLLPTDAAKKAEAIEKRDALRLLSVFMRHADNKGPNQSLVCNGDVNENGGCSGETTLLIQDIGTSFGYGTSVERHTSKVNFEDWKRVPIWRDSQNCVAELGPNDCKEMETPKISREGHAFLSRLLRGFSEGPEGRARVEALFRMANAQDRGASIDQWTSLFLSKVKELEAGCRGEETASLARDAVSVSHF